MSKLLFVIGMRRSGTSILRTILNSHSEISLLFEPTELLFTCQTIHIKRYSQNPYHLETIKKFKKDYGKWFGGKIALNCGIEAMNWKWLEEKFEKPHYIFIKRNVDDTYASWAKLDSQIGVRGIVSKEIYTPWWKHINDSFEDLTNKNPDRACIINYDKLVQTPINEMDKAFKLLNLTPVKNIELMIKKPNNWSAK